MSFIAVPLSLLLSTTDKREKYLERTPRHSYLRPRDYTRLYEEWGNSGRPAGYRLVKFCRAI